MKFFNFLLCNDDRHFLMFTCVNSSALCLVLMKNSLDEQCSLSCLATTYLYYNVLCYACNLVCLTVKLCIRTLRFNFETLCHDIDTFSRLFDTF